MSDWLPFSGDKVTIDSVRLWDSVRYLRSSSTEQLLRIQQKYLLIIALHLLCALETVSCEAFHRGLI